MWLRKNNGIGETAILVEETFSQKKWWNIDPKIEAQSSQEEQKFCSRWIQDKGRENIKERS